LLSILATGWYFEQTFAPADDDASADDYRIRALVAVLSGEPLDVEMVLTEYVERLLEDEGEEFPSFRVSRTVRTALCARRSGASHRTRRVRTGYRAAAVDTQPYRRYAATDTSPELTVGTSPRLGRRNSNSSLNRRRRSRRISLNGVAVSSSAHWSVK